MPGRRRLPCVHQGSLESGEETDSTCTTTASRRSSGSDSGLGGNLSELEPRLERIVAAPGPVQSEECPSKTEGKERRGRDEETEEDGKKEGEEENGEGNPNLSSLPMTGLPLAGALFGMCLGGPVGLLAGVKLGGVAAVGGSILGYTGASVIKEQKEMREHIDEYYTKEPDLYTLTPREEVLLTKRRQSERTPPQSPGRLSASGSRRERVLPPPSPGLARRKYSERHLESRQTYGSVEWPGPGRPSPHLRRPSRHGPRGYRPVPGAMESRSANSSPVARRRAAALQSSPAARRRQAMRQSSTEEEPVEQQPRLQRRPPNLCYNRNFRRLGDLSEEEQRSVVALICNKGPVVPAPALGQTFTVTAHVCQVDARQVADAAFTPACPQAGYGSPRSSRRRQQKMRASSLPDVLEEDAISTKS